MDSELSFISGRTASPKVAFTMREVLSNIELKGIGMCNFLLSPRSVQSLPGTSMGSQRELMEATEFIAKRKIIPVVSDILDGLENFEKAFDAMKEGSQFGKIVIRMREENHKGKL